MKWENRHDYKMDLLALQDNYALASLSIKVE
jgi:hypothetical protein